MKTAIYALMAAAFAATSGVLSATGSPVLGAVPLGAAFTFALYAKAAANRIK